MNINYINVFLIIILFINYINNLYQIIIIMSINYINIFLIIIFFINYIYLYNVIIIMNFLFITYNNNYEN